jgi:hypothetical protein
MDEFSVYSPASCIRSDFEATTALLKDGEVFGKLSLTANAAGKCLVEAVTDVRLEAPTEVSTTPGEEMR